MGGGGCILFIKNLFQMLIRGNIYFSPERPTAALPLVHFVTTSYCMIYIYSTERERERASSALGFSFSPSSSESRIFVVELIKTQRDRYDLIVRGVCTV